MRKYFLLIGVIIFISIQTFASKSGVYTDYAKCGRSDVTQLSAQKYDCLLLGDISKSSHERNVSHVFKSEIVDAGNDFENLPRNARVRKLTRSDVKFKDVSLSQPGTLASALGDEINEIDSLVVRGPINAEDFHTIWSSSFYGGLIVANLEYAQIAGNRMRLCQNRRSLFL